MSTAKSMGTASRRRNYLRTNARNGNHSDELTPRQRRRLTRKMNHRKAAALRRRRAAK